MTEKYQTNCFDKALEKFIMHIESLWTTLPTINKTIENSKKKSQEKHDEFLINFCSKTEIEDQYLVPTEHLRKNRLLKKSIQNSFTAEKIIKRNFLVSLLSQFDMYIGDLIKAVYQVNPNLLNASEKQFTFSELSKFSSLEHAKEFIIEKEIETVLRDNYTEQFKWFEKKLNIKLRSDLPIWSTFIEISQRRNLFVHNDAKISTQYISICKENRVIDIEKLKIGNELNVTNDYFEKAFKCLFEIGVKLNQVIRRNLCDSEIDKADESFLNISYDLIQNSQLDLAKILYDFSDKYIKKYSSENLRLRILLNRAQTYKWLNQEEECKKIINSHDWSASNNLFKMVSLVLIDNFEEAAKLMLTLGENNELISKSSYSDWPIFREFRKTNIFKNTYKEVYKVDYEVLEYTVN